ncbi:MAG: hypothetical protein QM779_11605 [Propionicimonas sp.]
MAAIWIGMTDNNLPHVLAVDQRVYEPTQPVEWKLIMTLVMAVSMVAVAGVWKFDRADVGQLLAAVWAGFWFLAAMDLLYSVQFSGPDAVCTYRGCWPSPFQEVIIAVPAGVALIVMCGLAVAGRPRRALVRGTLPAVVLVVLAVVQELVWRPVVLPVLLGPTPG